MDSKSKKVTFLIKGLSVRRGDAPAILTELVTPDHLVLTRFRSWRVCRSTWGVIESFQTWDKIRKDQEDTVHRTTFNTDNWVIQLQSDQEDLYGFLDMWFGPDDVRSLKPGQLRYKYAIANIGGRLPHHADTVFYLPPEEKMDLFTDLMF